MTPDLDKLQAGMLSSLNKTKLNKKTDKKQLSDVEPRSMEHQEIEDNVVGRSAVKMDNFDSDMKMFKNNPAMCSLMLDMTDYLQKRGYTYEDAIQVVMSELGVAEK